MTLLPSSATPDARRLIVTRAVRGFADGMVSVVLADVLLRLGLSAGESGAILSGTLLGSAALTIALGLAGHRISPRSALLGACALMLVTGTGFASLSAFVPLLAVAVIGTLNPSAGDVSVFLPAEQSVLAGATSAADRTMLFAWWNLAGSIAGALGSLAGALPDLLSRGGSIDPLAADRGAFVVYAIAALAVAPIYAGLARTPRATGTPSAPLARSRNTVVRLAALFSIDAFGGGFVVQSMLVLWLHLRFGMTTAAAGATFFGFGLLAAASQFVSARISARIGHVRTMVFTHLPANFALMLAALMPTAPLAIFFLAFRAATSSMDVPARQAYVLSVVPPEERAAAASLTNVPRSLASAIPPLLAGWMLDRTSFGWPLLIAGGLKAGYDLLLLAQFRSVRPLAENS